MPAASTAASTAARGNAGPTPYVLNDQRTSGRMTRRHHGKGLSLAATIVAAVVFAVPAAAQIPYEVSFEGVEDDDLGSLLRESSRLESLKEDPPASRAGLERRIAEDMERFEDVLQSRGFYGASLDYRLEGNEPVRITVAVETGPVYLLADYDIVYLNWAAAEGLPRSMEDLGLELGMRAEGAPITGASRDLIDLLAEQGRPLARIVNTTHRVDHRDTTLSTQLTVDPGPPSQFGETRFTGTTSIEDGYLDRFIPWQAGETYDKRQVSVLRRRLTGTGLFSAVQITNAEQPDASGRLPMRVHVVEAKHRSIAVGGGYASDEGFSVGASWEHRNIFGAQESVAVVGEFGETIRSLALRTRKPNVLRLDQDLLADLEFRQVDSDAFDELAVTAFVGLERKLFENWRISGGTAFELSEQNDNQGRRTFELFSLPLSASRDDTDSVLDPTEGTRLTVSVTPYFGVIEQQVTFVHGEIAGSAYQALDADDRFIAAARFRLASVAGEETTVIPASKRLFAGGGGSVRGYDFQSVGPLDTVGDALGGRSVVEVGAEMRIRVFGDFGVVPFIEGGNVYDEATPEAFTDALWAAGLGFRYYTAIGPLRLDFAFPLNPRDRFDDAFQFYISLGQAF